MNPLGAIRDTLAITKRNLIGITRTPQLLVFSSIQPVIFVVLFRYVFGGAIKLPGGIPYVDYLMPGIFVQTVVFGAVTTAIGLATDVQSGLLERFRSLPMARSAVLAGRTTADTVRNLFVIGLMVAVGFLVGFSLHAEAWRFLVGILLILAFAYSLSWIFATVGLVIADPEAAQAAAFPVMAPLVFASSAFVSVDSMPSWLQGFARHQPVSVTANAMRWLIGIPHTGSAGDLWQSIGWTIGIVGICAPIAVWRYRRAV